MTTRRRRRPATVPPTAPTVDTVDIGDITPYERNPRDNQNAIESTANSIRTYGFLVPIILDGEGTIVAGHTRYAAAISLGLTEVPCIRATHLTEEQVRQFRIIDNKVAELARWDFDLLAGELQALADTGIPWTQYGFHQEEIDCLHEVVAEDCLGAGGLTDMSATAAQQRAERRAPSQTRLVLGEVSFFIPQGVYREWISHLRNECDYDEAEMVRRIKGMLRIDQFEG